MEGRRACNDEPTLLAVACGLAAYIGTSHDDQDPAEGSIAGRDLRPSGFAVENLRAESLPRGPRYLNLYGDSRANINLKVGLWSVRRDDLELGDLQNFGGDPDRESVIDAGSSRLSSSQRKSDAVVERALAHGCPANPNVTNVLLDATVGRLAKGAGTAVRRLAGVNEALSTVSTASDVGDFISCLEDGPVAHWNLATRGGETATADGRSLSATLTEFLVETCKRRGRNRCESPQLLTFQPDGTPAAIGRFDVTEGDAVIADAIRGFGQPSQTDASPVGCAVSWNDLGIKGNAANFG